jgi:hypothetical protein
MELNFNEINDNNNNYNNNYWNNLNQKPKKNKITYDDILSSLNLAVNENGVLQYMTPKINTEPSQNKTYTVPQFSQKNEETIKISKIEPQLKNSAIYNKYFKNYKEEPSQEEEIKPLTVAEYNRMVLQNRIKRIQEQQRISQIKSKKMLFTSETNSTIKYMTPHNLNRLFKY